MLEILIPYLFIGVVAGLCSGLFGMGGGTVIVPFLLFLGVSSHEAVAISVTQMIFSSLWGSYLNIKKGNLYLKDALLVALGACIGGSFSGKLLELISSKTLSLIFLFLSSILCLKFFFQKEASSHKKNVNFKKGLVLVLAGAFSGLIAIALGIGGGLILAPILGVALGLSSKKIVPITLFAIIFASAAGIFSFYKEGLIGTNELEYGAIVGVCSMIGASFGIRLMDKLSQSLHKKILLFVFFCSISFSLYSTLREFGVLDNF